MTKMTDSEAAEVLSELRDLARTLGTDDTNTIPPDDVAALDIAIARLREPAGVGGEWVLVPREPTPEMHEAGHASSLASCTPMGADFPEVNRRIYVAMLTAAPQPSAEAQAQGGPSEVSPNVWLIGGYAVSIDGASIVVSKDRRVVVAVEDSGEQAQGGGGLGDKTIEALNSLDNDADTLRATGCPAMSGRIRDARNILHAAIFRNTPPSVRAQGGGVVVWPMTEAEVRQWIGACNHEPARQVLRDYLQLRTAPQPPAEAQPVGWVPVPVRVTPEMRAAWDRAPQNEDDDVEFNMAYAAMLAAATSALPEIHPDDAAVDAFAAAMKEKLAAARAKGRGGWNGDEPGMQQRLSDMLRGHVEKGDPRDVANFAMFLHQRGESILPPAEAQGDARMDQLRKFVEWERATHPGETHIAEWALYELRRLRVAPRAEAQAQGGGESVATVRVTHGGFGMELSTHVAYALPEGMHELFSAAPPSAPVGVGGECLAALRDYQQVNMEGVMVKVSRQALDEAIASLSAPQPPAEAQAQGGGEVVAEVVLHDYLLYGRLSKDLPVGTKLYLAPPSAPVGVEGLLNCLPLEVRSANGYDAAWVAGFNEGVLQSRQNLQRHLAQQPAAPTWIGIDWAEGQQPAAEVVVTRGDDGEIIRVTQGDRVIAATTHAGGKQPAAVDEANTVDWRAMYRFQTAMRFMDNNPQLTKERAYKMADDDCAGLAAQGAHNE